MTRSIGVNLTDAQIAALLDLESCGCYYHHGDHALSTYRALQRLEFVEESTSKTGGFYITPEGTDVLLLEIGALK